MSDFFSSPIDRPLESDSPKSPRNPMSFEFFLHSQQSKKFAPYSHNWNPFSPKIPELSYSQRLFRICAEFWRGGRPPDPRPGPRKVFLHRFHSSEQQYIYDWEEMRHVRSAHHQHHSILCQLFQSAANSAMLSGRSIGPPVCLHIVDAGVWLRPLGREFESAERRMDQRRNKMGRRRGGESAHILGIPRVDEAIATSMTVRGS
jgi:hypothetical protein